MEKSKKLSKKDFGPKVSRNHLSLEEVDDIYNSIALKYELIIEAVVEQDVATYLCRYIIFLWIKW